MRTNKQNIPSAEIDKTEASSTSQRFTSTVDFSSRENVDSSEPTLLTINQLCQLESALTTGGIRHLLFTKGHDLPGVYHFGRKLLFDRKEFMQGIKQGSTANISGGSAQ